MKHLKTYEEVGTIKPYILNYVLTDKQLAERGYKFQKLYANNYITYRKNIPDKTG